MIYLERPAAGYASRPCAGAFGRRKKMNYVIKVLAALLFTGSILAEPSDTHIDLRETASWAVRNSNVELLRALLQAGVQIDEPVDDEENGYTLLHLAAIYNKPRIAQFLFDNGAWREVRDKSGARPIDIAFQGGYTNVCQILEKPSEKEEMVGDFPEEVLRQVLRLEVSKEPTFVTFNGTNAPAVFVEWVGRSWKDVRPASQSELSEGTEKETGHIQDRKTKEPGRDIYISIKKTEDGYEWAVTSYHGPLAAHQVSGKMIKRYGYWIRTEVKGWQA